jgi:hypothetical protein
LLYGSASPLTTRHHEKDTTMNARKIASKVLTSLAVLAAIATLSGCVVAPGRGYYGRSYHRSYWR